MCLTCSFCPEGAEQAVQHSQISVVCFIDKFIKVCDLHCDSIFLRYWFGEVDCSLQQFVFSEGGQRDFLL